MLRRSSYVPSPPELRTWRVHNPESVRTLPVLKRVVDYGTEDKAVSDCGRSPEFKHIHRLQKGMPMTQAAKGTRRGERR